MLDQYFDIMARSGFATWEVHGRCVPSDGRPRVLSVPHADADAITFLEVMVPRLLASSQQREQGSAPPSLQVPAKLVVPQGANLKATRFQNILAALIDASSQGPWALSPPLKVKDKIAVAVDLRDDPRAIFAPNAKNLIACPILRGDEWGKLVAFDAIAWKQAMKDQALDELDRYRVFWPMVARLEARGGPRLQETLAAFPLNEAALLVSYWGDLNWRLPTTALAVREALAFAVTATRGPRRIAIAWSVGRRSFATICEPGAGAGHAWNTPLLEFSL